MNLSPKDKFVAAISRVTDSTGGIAPYFGAVLRGLVRREMPSEMVQAMEAHNGKATLGVTEDGILYWSTKFVQEQDLIELAYALMHETMHVLLKHHERARELAVTPENQHAANCCQDACINESLREMVKATGRQETPAWWVYPEKLKQPPKLTFEERYRRLPKCTGVAGVATGWCGGAAGRPLPGEVAGGSGGGRSEPQMERFRKEVASAIREHAGKHPGTVPGSLARWADEMLAPPKIDWRQKLVQSVREAIAFRPGAMDFDWRRPSRRQAGLGYGVGRPIMPAYRASVCRTAVVVDTSGSMGRDELKDAASELHGVLDAAGAAVTVCACDAAVHELREVKTIEEAVGLFIGGGGTDMAPALAALAEKRPQPELTIVLTDSYIGDPGPEPPYKVLWAIVGDADKFEPEFGDVIFIERNKKAA